MILGAGRGPLARAALNAAERTGRKVRVYIIEKNPNAIRTLTAIANKLWHNKGKHYIHIIKPMLYIPFFPLYFTLQMFIYSPKICASFHLPNPRTF